MRNALRSAAAVVRRDATLAVRQPLASFGRWFSPIIGLAGFYFIARLVDPHRTLDIDGRRAGYFAYVSVNLSFMLLQTSALQAIAQTVRFDQLFGTLEPVLGSSTPPAVLIASCGVWPLAVSVVQVALSLGVAATFMGLDLHATDVPALLAFAGLSTLAMGAIGVLGAAAVIRFKGAPPSNYLVGGAASLLAGTLFPTHLLPGPLQFAAWCLPLTHALRGLRAAVAGEPIAAVAGDAIWLAAAAAVLLPVSFALLTRAIERGRCDGTLAHY